MINLIIVTLIAATLLAPIGARSQAPAFVETSAGCRNHPAQVPCDAPLPEEAARQSFLGRMASLDALVPPPPIPQPGSKSCTSGAADPTGELRPVETSTETPRNQALGVRFEIESGLGIDGSCWVAETLRILNHPSGWGSQRDVAFRQVDGPAAIRIVLASPRKVDQLCWPLRTVGIFSCRSGGTVVLNVWRWTNGADSFGDDVTTYRQYLVNHEVGHALGYDHAGCPAAGAAAPVMMQQTKSVASCVPNGWPALG